MGTSLHTLVYLAIIVWSGIALYFALRPWYDKVVARNNDNTIFKTVEEAQDDFR